MIRFKYIFPLLAIGIAALALAGKYGDMLPIDPSTLPLTSDLAGQLRNHVEYLASPDLKGRKPGTAGNQAAARYIIEQFRQTGLTPLASLGGHTQTIASRIGDNVIGIRPARTPQRPERWILLGAHYDHLGESGGKIYAGADDNASAIAILLETAKTMASLTNYSIMFVAFNAEEPPFIRTPMMGSQYFVDHLPREIASPKQFQAVIIMDLMGGVHWQPLKNVVFAAGAEQSPGLYRHVKELGTLKGHDHDLIISPVGLHLIEEIPFVGQTAFSDYDAFRNASVPFVFLSAGRTPRYHQPSDRPNTLYYERMALTVRWFTELLENIDQDGEPYEFQPHRIEFADDVATFRPLITQAAEWKTCIPGTSPLSFLRFQLDDRWMAELDPTRAQEQDIKRLEKTSIRLQCLLADFSACFLI